MTGYCAEKGLEGEKHTRRPARSVVSESRQEMLVALLGMAMEMRGSGRVLKTQQVLVINWMSVSRERRASRIPLGSGEFINWVNCDAIY